ncbi:MAG: serine/threonine protein kinase [Nannocystis sp.]|uniref:protein kinase domain-containing protein n=1 Tax=Nannocystis sp. TaxID=1962667 RepID=UPI002421A595|nr:serine/threonine-protein kinase [Nannocystis sp.]MBK9757769.1 serine/threonine protein kinase [Nannocystis sp.]
MQSLLRPTGPEQPRQPLPWTQAVSIVRELLKALGTLHDCGVVHRDIKPGNCILEQRPDGDFLKLLDLGIVKVLPGFEMSGDHPRTQPEFVLGTPRYMAPEQFGGPVSDPRVDLYSAGIMLYEFLTGDIPARWYEQPGAAHPYDPLPPSQANPGGGIPPSLDALVLRAIAFEPHKRFPTAVAFGQALAELLHAGSPGGRGRLRSAPTPAAVPAPAPVALRVVPDLHDTADEREGRVGPLLRWWTIVATSCTAMVFVFAFAALLRRAESRPSLDLESDDTPAILATSRVRRSAGAASSPAAAEKPTVAATPPAESTVAATPSEEPPAAELAPPVAEAPPAAADPPQPQSQPQSQSRRPKPRAPDPEDPGDLMPVRPRSTLPTIASAAERDLQAHCGAAPRRSYALLVRLDAASGKVTGVELRGVGVDAKLRQCVEARASKAFAFDGLRAREASYLFTLSL